MRVGVFDSGVGGKSVASAIGKALPRVEVIFVNDREHMPYGSKSPEVLYALVLPILQDLASRTDVIVVACNTVSTTLIKQLREIITTPLVAMEPMVKPAAKQTKSKTIAICATPTTLASARYKQLKTEYAKDITVLEPDCSDWSSMIENNSVDRQLVQERIDAACVAGADVIVLGCTHYHWIEDQISEATRGRAVVMQPEAAVIRRLERIISEP